MTERRLISVSEEERDGLLALAQELTDFDKPASAELCDRLRARFDDGITEEEAGRLAEWTHIGIAETLPEGQSPKPGYAIVAKLAAFTNPSEEEQGG
jgi:hypothetical protein